MNLSSERVLSYFQPIFSADTHKVYAYEVLGRYLDADGAVRSLGPFFSDPATSNSEALRVDRMVRHDAMQKYASELPDCCLFINIRLAWLSAFKDSPRQLPTIQWAEELGINPNRLVIEITEEEYKADIEAYARVLEHYKSRGCRIAIDDYGKKASDIDRLSVVMPDIMKINMEYIQKSVESYHYKAYLRALASFAEDVGIEVLYEGVETLEQLDVCMSAMGRYYQGFLFAKPQPSLCEASEARDTLLNASRRVFAARRQRTRFAKDICAFLDDALMRFLAENRFDSYLIGESAKEGLDGFLTAFYQLLPENVQRVYLCDRAGTQLSRNIERNQDGIFSLDYRGKNWAWRGYFHEILTALEAGHTSCISSPYRDFTTKNRMFTYAATIDAEYMLMIDILRIPVERNRSGGLE